MGKKCQLFIIAVYYQLELFLKSKNDNHRTFRHLIIQLADVIDMHYHASPGKVTWTLIIPLLNPTVEAYTAAQGGVFQCRRTPLPVCANCCFLFSRNAF